MLLTVFARNESGGILQAGWKWLNSSRGWCATKQLTPAGGNFCDASSISRWALKEKSSYQSKQADDEVYTEWCVTQQAHASFLMRKPQSHLKVSLVFSDAIFANPISTFLNI